jgi:hypothetical protein
LHGIETRLLKTKCEGFLRPVKELTTTKITKRKM